MTNRSRIRGVTLLELLVACAVLAILALLLIQVLNNTSSAWIQGQAQAERRQSARALGDAIAQELQAALLPLDPTDQKSLQFLVNPGSVSNGVQNPDTVFWQAPIATDRKFGDIAEVGYFLKWDESNASQPRPRLCRFFVNPTDKANYLIVQDPTAWLGGSILARVAPADSANSYQGLFAENVVGLWVRCYDKNGVVSKSFDSRSAKNLPQTVKVSLVLVGAQSLVRLEKKPDYASAGSGDEPDLDAFIRALPRGVRETAQSYVTEVKLQNAL